ncbi:hypothetical protein BSKO_12187 [Bryopsis sp. KO-2023]|nr:hypothetical protein BSKO_12187 [Bryopsis sp. KO-2023]
MTRKKGIGCIDGKEQCMIADGSFEECSPASKSFFEQKRSPMSLGLSSNSPLEKKKKKEAPEWTSVKNAGLPWELSLAETHQNLVANDLRSSCKLLQAAAKMRTGLDITDATLLRDEKYGFNHIGLHHGLLKIPILRKG